MKRFESGETLSTFSARLGLNDVHTFDGNLFESVLNVCNRFVESVIQQELRYPVRDDANRPTSEDVRYWRQ